MSRCPYCRRELPGFETICQQCLEAGYQRIAHPKTWSQRLRVKDSLGVFLFVFAYAYIVGQINRDHHPKMTGLALLALILAAFLVFLEIGMGDSSGPKAPRRLLYGFLSLFVYFFLRLWSAFSYHPMEDPALFAFVFATIAAIVESVRTYPPRV